MTDHYCPFCGSPLQATDKFCPLCGTALDASAGHQDTLAASDLTSWVDDAEEKPGDSSSSYHTPVTEPPSWVADSMAQDEPTAMPQAPTPMTAVPLDSTPVSTPLEPHPVAPHTPKAMSPLMRQALIALAAFLIVGGGVLAALGIFNHAKGGMCTVLFETRGGTSLPPQEVEAGTYLTSPENPEKEDYEFKAWYTDAERTKKADFPFLVTEDTIFYARYRKPHEEPVAAQYTVAFETSGGSTVASQTVNDGSALTSPQDPTRSGYVFAGWYADANYSSTVTFPLTVTSDITLYAKWEKAAQPKQTSSNTNTNKSTSSSNGGTSMVVNSAAPGYVNVRSSATYNSTALLEVYPGTAMYWYGKSAQGKAADDRNHTWYYVNVAGTDVWGWVFAEYISAGSGSPLTQPSAPQPSGTPLTLGSKAPGYLVVRSSSTYYSSGLYTLYPGDIVYWDGGSASGKAADDKNHTWYHVNVAGTDIWGWVFAEYTTRA